MNLKTVCLALLVLSGCATKQLNMDLSAKTAALAACEKETAAAKMDAEVVTVVSMWAEKRMNAFEKIAKMLRDALLDDEELLIFIRNGQMVVRLPTAIYFERGKAALQPEGKEILTRMAEKLKTLEGRSFVVAAHTDDEPVSAKSKTFKSNLELSALRGVAGFEFLKGLGLDPKNMAAAGYGEYLPIADNATPEGKALNRRLEIVILPSIDELPKMPETL